MLYFGLHADPLLLEITVEEYGVRLSKLETKMAEVDQKLESITRIQEYFIHTFQIPPHVAYPQPLPEEGQLPPPLPPKPTSAATSSLPSHPQSHGSLPPPLLPKPTPTGTSWTPTNAYTPLPPTAYGCLPPPFATSRPSRPMLDHPAQTTPAKSLGRLQSSVIDKRVLVPADVVLTKYPGLIGKEGKTGELACKLARESFFGEELMAKCTASGYADKPGLPQAELLELKEIIRKHSPQYSYSPHEFEILWSKCLEAISQCCKILRKKNRT